MSTRALAAAPAPRSAPARAAAAGPVLGLRENWRQFALLVLVNAFVGAMVGLERSVLPLLGEREFGLATKSAALSFVATFGVVKALTNLLAAPTTYTLQFAESAPDATAFIHSLPLKHQRNFVILDSRRRISSTFSVMSRSNETPHHPRSRCASRTSR